MFDLMRELAIESRSKIVLLVADGLGGLPREPGGPTELEAAVTPHLDGLVARNVCGLSHSGRARHHARQRPRPSRPVRLRPARLHRSAAACSRRSASTSIWGRTTSRRAAISAPSMPTAGSPTAAPAGSSSEVGARAGREAARRPDRGRRDFRRAGQGLSLRAGDPRAGPRRRHRRHRSRDDRRAAPQAGGPRSGFEAHRGDPRELHRPGGRIILKDDHPANMITLRGIAKRPPIPQFEEVYRLRAGAIAVYPMYRGLARLVGMTIFSAGHEARRPDRGAAPALGRCRLLLRALQVYRCRRRGWRLRAQGRLHRGARRGDPGASSISGRTC